MHRNFHDDDNANFRGKEWSEKVYVAERLMRFITSDELRTFKQIIPAVENVCRKCHKLRDFHEAFSSLGAEKQC